MEHPNQIEIDKAKVEFDGLTVIEAKKKVEHEILSLLWRFESVYTEVEVWSIDITRFSDFKNDTFIASVDVTAEVK